MVFYPISSQSERMGPARLKAIPQLRTNDIFQDELIPLFAISKFIGLFSYNKNMKVSLVHISLELILHLGVSGLIVFFLYEAAILLKQHEIPYYDVQVTIMFLNQGLNLILILSHVIIMIKKRNKFQELIDMLLSIDSWWNKHSTLYSKNFTKIGMLIISLFYISMPLIYQPEEKNVILYLIGSCFTDLCFFLIDMQFCSILDIILKHLRKLREELFNDELHLLSSIAKHQTLMQFCPVVNEAYSWQILVMCFKFFAFSLMVTYLIILDSQALMENVIRFIALMWIFALLFPIARTCSEIEDEADNFNNKLFNLMRESKDLCSNDKLHLYVTMKQSVSFTACGFFALGYPLVTSIIAAATTYLVILVQFSMS